MQLGRGFRRDRPGTAGDRSQVGDLLLSPPPATLDKTHQAKLDKLSKLQGKDFTKHYDDMQVPAHKDTVSLFQRYAKDGDNPELKAFAGKTLPKLQEHLKMAEALEK